MKPKPILSLREAAGKVPNGVTLLVGGFGMTGNPVHLLHAIAETGASGLTYIGNNIGEAGIGGGRLLRNGQVKKAIGSFFTSNPEAVAAVHDGRLEVELLPQGTLAEAMRAGGAGLGGFYTPTGADTDLAVNREVRVIDGKQMVLIQPIRGDVALIRAWRADTLGNLQYRMTENNFNQAAATAAEVVIVEAEEIVPAGSISPEAIHTPGVFVDYLTQATLTPEDLGSSVSVSAANPNIAPERMQMARAAIAHIDPGEVVNLGIGIPTLVAELITPEHGIMLHSENGMLGVGPAPQDGGAMDYPVNAGKVPVTALPGSSYFDSAASFGLIRGGHIDVAVIGGLQVDESASLANWAIPGKPLLGVGGAMDLATGARKLIVLMTHCDRNGNSKVVSRCTLPLTCRGGVDVLITDLAVFHFIEGKMVLVELMPDVDLDTVRDRTQAEFAVLPEFERG